MCPNVSWLFLIFLRDNCYSKARNVANRHYRRITQLLYSYLLGKDKNDTCDTPPSSSIESLPPGCYVTSNGSNVTSLDVGKCVSEPCVLRGDQTPGRCCVPVAMVVVAVTCTGSDPYNVTKVVSCGCGECEDDGEVAVTGYVGIRDGNATALVPVNATLLVSGSDDIDDNDTRTFGNGQFSFSATPKADKIVVRFYQDDNADFLPQVIVIDVPRGVATVSRQVALQAKPDPVSVDASVGGDVKMSSAKGSPSVQIPPGAIVDANGDTYNGTVKVYATFADPRVLESIADAPGDFSFNNEEGVAYEVT